MVLGENFEISRAVILIRDQESAADTGKNSGLNNRSFFPLKRKQPGRGPV